MRSSILKISLGRSAVPHPLASYDRLMLCYRMESKLKLVFVMEVSYRGKREIISPRELGGLSRMASRSV